MSHYDFSQTREFIYRNARLVERRLFAALFEDGPSAAVKAALLPYQNPDGGFGNALESDLRTPVSQPLAVERAFQILSLAGELSGDMVLRACDWLDSVSDADGGVPFVLPGVENYPHTPWMIPAGPAGQLNPTASLCGLLLQNHVDHPWVARASAFCWKAIPNFTSSYFHEVMPVISFLTHTPEQRDLAEELLQHLKERIALPGVVSLDPQAEGYVQFPLDWAPRPDSFLRPIFSDALIEQHLAALAAKQQADGGWPITWEALGPGAIAEWRGVFTLDTLLRFRDYGYE